MFRVGFGYDVHRLTEGRTLVLGGVPIPHHHGLLGHSDADVLTHAVIDAILGALAMGDIGEHFPDTDPTYEGLSSLVMLEKVAGWVAVRGYLVMNVDATIVAQGPRLAPYFKAMRERVSKALRTPVQQISIKATTSEGMGFCGRKEGMAAYAVVCLIQAQGKNRAQ